MVTNANDARDKLWQNQENSASERGKRLCIAGTIVEIEEQGTKENPGSLPISKGSIMDGNLNVAAFLAVGSSGDIVEKTFARFCGIATGIDTYSNSGGGTTHAVQLVGMFDLPANKKSSVKVASKSN